MSICVYVYMCICVYVSKYQTFDIKLRSLAYVITQKIIAW